MKSKLLIFLSALVTSLSLALVNIAPAQAEGEQYKWINATTIQASGGLYHNVTAANNGVINFPKDGNVFRIFSEGSCDITMTITASADNRQGTLQTEGCDGPAAGFDRSFTIANPENGPSLSGSDITYTENTNCNQLYTATADRQRCEAIKACVVDLNNTKNACVDAWATCMTNTNNIQTCVARIGSGDLENAGDDEVDPEAATTCAIEGVGWIICPVMTLLAKLVDGAYAFVAALLRIEPLLTDGTGGVYEAWSVMRNIANVAFVVAFLIIIFSQLTSIGITNYGIKKMLPRLIVAAILVNISYWICAIAVDLSNILGQSLYNLFIGFGESIPTPNAADFGATNDELWSQVTVLVIAGTIATGVALYVGLSALVPAILAAFLAIVTVFLVLTIRQALIVLLIVVSPLAFVAYLLPNTESWFGKWRSLFQTLLLMFPIIALIFGVSAVASQIVMGSATGPPGVKTAVQIMGALISIIPLALTPIIMKSAGGLLNRFGAFVNNPNKGPFDRMRKGAEGYRKNRQTLRQGRALRSKSKWNPYARGVRRQARRDAVNASREAGLKSAQTRYVAEEALAEDGKLATQMASGSKFVAANEQAKAAVIASALSQEKKALQEDVSDMEALIKVRFDNPEDALKEALQKGDKVQAIAAQNVLFKSGGSGISKFRETVEKAEAEPGAYKLGDVADDLKANVRDYHGQYAKQKGADVISWAGTPGANLSSSHAGQLSDNDVAGQHSKGLEKMVDKNNVSAEQARRMLDDPRVSANLDDAKKAALQKAINNNNTGSGPPPASPSPSGPTPPPTSPPPASPTPPPNPAPSTPDNRSNPTPDELRIAHEEANYQNALHDMEQRSPSPSRDDNNS